jgi:hypothetical protein
MNSAIRIKYDGVFATIRTINPLSVIIESQRYASTIDQVKKGGCIRFDDKTFVVTELSHYRDCNAGFKKPTGKPWYELKLFCLETGETVYLEWEKDDEVEVWVTTAEINFTGLYDKDGQPLTADMLDRIVDKESAVSREIARYEYDDDYPCLYYRDGQGDGEPVFMYEFAAGKDSQLSFEKWAGENGKSDWQVFLSKQISSKSIEVISLGE